MITPALGPNIRTAENRNVSEMEISAWTFGRRMVAVPLMSVRPATTSHSIPGKSDYFQPSVGHSECPSQDHRPHVQAGSEVHSSLSAPAESLPEGRTPAWTSRSLTSQSKR